MLVAGPKTHTNFAFVPDHARQYSKPQPAVGVELVGIDPRKFPTSDLRDLGHPESCPKIIRAKCLDVAFVNFELWLSVASWHIADVRRLPG
jgi:hypothetical protein